LRWIVANQWQRCTLDDDSLQQFNLYKEELSEVEAEIAVLETTMKAQIYDLNRTTKVAATFTTESPSLLTNHRLKFTATTAGTDIHKYTVILANPGANGTLTLYPPAYGSVPTGALAKMFYDSNVIYVEVETDSSADVITTPADLKAEFTAAGYDLLFTTTVVDSGGPLPLVADGTQYKFEGGKDTPLKDLTAGFNDLYAGTGKDADTALEQLGIPVAKSGQSAAQVLQQTSDLIPLSTGTLVKCSGQNLISLRAMWNLLGASSAASTTVCGLLPGQSGYPLVIWTRQVTTTVTLAACDGGGTRTDTTTEVVGNVNQRPSQTSGMTPYVFWLESISPSVETLKALSKAGLNDTQVQTALDESEETVYIIPEPALLTTYSITCAELLELFGLTCEGITSVGVEDALSELGDSPADASNGFMSAAFNFPGGPTGVNIRNALSPETAMTEELAALSQTKCIDPFAVGSITSLIASASAMIDMATSTVERVRSTVMGTLNTISGIVANIQGILSIAEKIGCLIPLDFMASVKAPALDTFLLPQIDLAIPQINGLLDTVQAIMEKVQKVICQVVSAINSLIGAALSGAECLVPGITNAIANAFGFSLPNPLDMLPCIENPFDLVGLFQDLLGKITALSDMIVTMINDILSIASQLQLSVNIEDQTGVKEATGDCSSGPLGAMASSIKSKLSV
jgi:hypothetical protein